MKKMERKNQGERKGKGQIKSKDKGEKMPREKLRCL